MQTVELLPVASANSAPGPVSGEQPPARDFASDLEEFLNGDSHIQEAPKPIAEKPADTAAEPPPEDAETPDALQEPEAVENPDAPEDSEEPEDALEGDGARAVWQALYLLKPEAPPPEIPVAEEPPAIEGVAPPETMEIPEMAGLPPETMEIPEMAELPPEIVPEMPNMPVAPDTPPMTETSEAPEAIQTTETTEVPEAPETPTPPISESPKVPDTQPTDAIEIPDNVKILEFEVVQDAGILEGVEKPNTMDGTQPLAEGAEEPAPVASEASTAEIPEASAVPTAKETPEDSDVVDIDEDSLENARIGQSKSMDTAEEKPVEGETDAVFHLPEKKQDASPDTGKGMGQETGKKETTDMPEEIPAQTSFPLEAPQVETKGDVAHVAFTKPDAPPAEQVILATQLAVEDGKQEIRLKLAPASLGDLHITLTNTEGGLTAKIVAESPETQALLSSQLYQLEEQLKVRGIEVVDMDISCMQDMTEEGFQGQWQSGEQPRKMARIGRLRASGAYAMPTRDITGVAGTGARSLRDTSSVEFSA